MVCVIKKTNIWYTLFDILVVILMILVLLVTLYPFVNSLAISLNDADDTVRGGITFFPRVPTTRNYELVFTNDKIYTAYLVTIARTVIGTLGGLLLTSLFAFGMAHRNLKGRQFYTVLCIIPMYFGGGLVPFYFLLRSMGLMNSFWVYIIPNLVNIWNMILMRSYFQGIPSDLEESARIDGANYITVFFKIILPISTPIVATIALFVGVFQWNSWYDAAMYVTKQELKPMQSVLMNIINEAKFAEQLAQAANQGGGVDLSNVAKGKKVNVRSITMATMIVTVVPIILVYPFLQRYFIKGIMVGSLKVRRKTGIAGCCDFCKKSGGEGNEEKSIGLSDRHCSGCRPDVCRLRKERARSKVPGWYRQGKNKGFHGCKNEGQHGGRGRYALHLYPLLQL